ncbi:MAG: FecR domain-containing protein [Sphingorhabdus sp.]
MGITRFLLATCLAVAWVSSGSVVHAVQNETGIHYTVRKGDTLIKLSQIYLQRPDMYKVVQQHNRIRNAHAIPVGTVLSIPRNLLKFKPGNARLISVRGQVFVGEGRHAANGLVLNEGVELSTSASSFATLQLDDGSRISLPSNSIIRIRRLRTYFLNNRLDYDFEVNKGGMRSTVTKQKSSEDRYQVRTPKAVSAVRGTDFQSRFDPLDQKDFAEVVEGTLAVNTNSQPPEPLAAGNGLAVGANGSVVRELMLSEPTLIEPAKLQADPQVRFQIAPTPGAVAYRLSIATDAGFVEQVADVVTHTANAEVNDVENGRLFARVRAIAASGIEGKPATFAFRRRLNSVSASAGQGDEGYVFRWSGEGDGTRRYHFQLFRSTLESVPMIDEASIDSDRVTISDLPSGEYFWRVGVVQYLDGETATNWAPTEKMTIAD